MQCKVGIGTTAPGWLLDLRSNDTGTTASLGIRQLGSGDASIVFQTTTSPYGFSIGVDASDGDSFKIASHPGDVGSNTCLKIYTSGRALFDDTGVADRDGITARREGHTIGIGVDRTSSYWGGGIYTDGTKRVLIDGNGGVAIGSTVINGTPPTNGLLIGYTGGSYSSDATSGLINQNSSSGRATFRNRTVNDDASEIFFDVNGALRWDFSCRSSSEGYRMNLYPQAGTPVYNSVSQTQFTWFQNGNVQIKKSAAADTGYTLHVGGTIYADSDVIAYSDIISKTNLKPIENALEKISSITGYTFNRKTDNSRRFTGMVAQEVESVLPEAVYTNTDGTKGLAYSNTIGLLIEAIKELKTEINQLKGINNG